MQNVGKMVKALAAMQQNVDKVQKELAATEFIGNAANGLVKIVITGKGDVVSGFMTPAVRDEDAETISALFVVAFNDANRQKEAVAKSKLGAIGAGLLPTGLKLPGF